MPRCCIVQCSSRKNKNQPQLSLHRMPKNEKCKTQWLNIIGKEHINPRQKDWFICSLHFEESCFNRTLGVVRLRDDAVPSASRLFPVGQKPSVSNETDNVSLGHSSAIIPPLQNVEIAIQELPVVQRRTVADETNIIPLGHGSAMTSAMQNVERASQEVLNKAKIKKLSQTCTLQRKKIKCLNEKVRQRNKIIALLNNIIDDLKRGNKINNDQSVLLKGKKRVTPRDPG